jgi:hypothetical protein
MNSEPVNSSRTPVNIIHSGAVVMPCREQFLLQFLQEARLEWKMTRALEHRSWESGGGSDPRCPDLDPPLSDRQFLRTPFGGFGRSMGVHIGMDWQTINSETLSASREQYDVFVKKTIVNSYSHQVRQSITRCWYAVEVVSREDKRQIVSFDEAGFPTLGAFFEEIAAKIK